MANKLVHSKGMEVKVIVGKLGHRVYSWATAAEDSESCGKKPPLQIQSHGD